MNISWALSFNTLQIYNNEIYATTVLGGNIIRIDKKGVTHIVWINDCDDPYIVAPYQYSVIFRRKIWFFPGKDKYIVVYDPTNNSVYRIIFIGKEDDEPLYPYIKKGKLYAIGMYTGKVWAISSNISIVHKGDSIIGKLHRFRGFDQNPRMLFVDKNSNMIAIYNSDYNDWEFHITKEMAIDGFVDNECAWYTTKDALWKYTPLLNSEKKIFEFTQEMRYTTISDLPGDRMLLVGDKDQRQYVIDKKTLQTETIKIDYFTKGYIYGAMKIDENKLFLLNVNFFDWILREDDSYAIYDFQQEKIITIPLFNMEEECSTVLKIRYKGLYDRLYRYRIVSEIDRTDLPNLIQSLIVMKNI